MKLYCFIVSFFYCLAPCDFTAFLWLIAMIIGGVIQYQNEQLLKKAAHAN